MNSFFKSFKNASSITLILGLLVISFFQYKNNKEIRAELISIQTDSTFHFIEYQDSIKGDTLLPVTKKGVIDAIVNLNKNQPAHQDLVLFANWAIPILDATAEQSRPKLKNKEGIASFTTFESWIEDQKALAQERQKEQKK